MNISVTPPNFFVPFFSPFLVFVCLFPTTLDQGEHFVSPLIFKLKLKFYFESTKK